MCFSVNVPVLMLASVLENGRQSVQVSPLFSCDVTDLLLFNAPSCHPTVQHKSKTQFYSCTVDKESMTHTAHRPALCTAHPLSCRAHIYSEWGRRAYPLHHLCILCEMGLTAKKYCSFFKQRKWKWKYVLNMSLCKLNNAKCQS